MTTRDHCAKSLQGEAPCGSAVYGKVDEMSSAPSLLTPPPFPKPPSPPSPPPQTPPPMEDKEDKEESATSLARNFALQLP